MRTISLVLTFSCFVFAVINASVPRAEAVAKAQDINQPLVQQMLLASR